MTNPGLLTCPRGHLLETPDDRFCPDCGLAVRCSRGHHKYVVGPLYFGE